MNKTITRILKIIGGTVAVIVIMLGILVVTFNNKSVQKKLLNKSIELLSQKLNTHVEIDSISINAFNLEISLFGIKIEDRNKREMLRIAEVSADVDLMRLLQKKIVIEKAGIEGAHALLLKPSKDEEANYQFVIDAFKKPKDHPKKDNSGKMDFDISSLALKDIHVQHNELTLYLQEASYKKGWITDQTILIDSLTLVCDTTYKAGLKPYNASIGHLKLNGDFAKQIIKADGYQIAGRWESMSKKGKVDNQASIGHLTVNTNRGHYSTSVKKLHYKNDNHLPRKNTGRPKRGFFDAKHLDITADLHFVLDSVSKDMISGRLDQCEAKDSITGIDFRKLSTNFKYEKNKIYLKDITIQQKKTVFNVTSGEIVLPNKKEGRAFSYATGIITGKAYLTDISRAFAPVLKKFTLPLNVSLTMKGTPNTISFRNVKVSTNDKQLTLAATGGITNLKDKYNLHVKFDISHMLAKTGVAETIINQFQVKKLMMKQLHNLGDISYQGSFSVLWKKQIFSGLLKTAVGDISVDLAIDGTNKYVNGKVSSKSFELGKAMNIKRMGPLAASASFTVDISKPRTAIMRKQKGGKLPIGSMNAQVEDCVFGGIHIRDLSASLNSDGAIAIGDVYQRGKFRDLYFSFSFTNTDEMHKLKIIKPGIRFHKMTDEYKQSRTERRQLKKELKAQKKLEKELKKQKKKLEKEQKKLEKKQQKEDAQDGEKKGFFKKLFSKKKKTETT